MRYDKLGKKQLKFIHHHCLYGGDPIDAVIAAGYRKKYAEKRVTELLKNPLIHRAINYIRSHKNEIKEVSRYLLTKDYDEIYFLSIIHGQFSAAVNCIKGKATLYGLDSKSLIIETQDDAKEQHLELEERIKQIAKSLKGKKKKIRKKLIKKKNKGL